MQIQIQIHRLLICTSHLAHACPLPGIRHGTPVPCPSPWHQGQPQDTIPALAAQLGAGLVVVDYSPMRIGRTWRQEVRCWRQHPKPGRGNGVGSRAGGRVRRCNEYGLHVKQLR
jgi:hypothetical protein